MRSGLALARGVIGVGTRRIIWLSEPKGATSDVGLEVPGDPRASAGTLLPTLDEGFAPRLTPGHQ